MIQRSFIFLIFTATLAFSLSCRARAGGDTVTIASPDKINTLNTLTAESSAASDDRVRTLMFNSLVKKDEKFDYVGDLAQEIKTSEDGKTVSFVLRDNVKFHNGKTLSSADVKYTFDEMFRSGKSYKAGAFYETVNNEKTPHITSIETTDASTVNFNLSRAALKNQLLSNLVAIPIIPEGTAAEQDAKPVGTGAFKFVGFDVQQNVIDLEANADYWEGAPQIKKVRVKTIADASSMQAELRSGGVDLAPLPSNLSPDALEALKNLQNLQVKQFNGSNIQYLQFNTQSPPLDKVKLRQAIAYGIDREKIIGELLFGQATLAHSILPVESWAYNAGTKYAFNPAKARQLVQESGYKGEPIKFKFAAGGMATSQYAQVIQNSLAQIGVNVEIEPLERTAFLTQQKLGQYQISTGIWVGGNQDPIFLNNLFTTKNITSEKVSCCNRSRYSNPQVDRLIDTAFNSGDREQAKQAYMKAQDIISDEVPMLPLWYPANMVVANKRIANINVGPSGDWTFVKDITVDGK